ncbi:hypothetical protein M2103_002245 [Ereboglobus sp. PH5-5]|uniref:GYF domain-containing protein n=1 Tax=Ereboglobus sp. PH5-5 TaxID=2940529 RepID=UPI002406E41B|nr:GYF domain-containing protein [Ereboglobus sp. PH5-5]MDF9834010.1 hypothetical protein [Ereboglobus sp. PH5-5]
MTYHIARNNQQLGTFLKDEVIARYNAGAILPTDLVWTDGMATWEPASKVFGAPAAPVPAAPPPVTGVAEPMTTMPSPGLGAAGPSMDTRQRPANNMTLAVVATVLNVIICNLLGLACSVIAIVMSAQVNKKFDQGDLSGAQSSAKTSKVLGWVAIGLFVFGLVLSIFVFATGMMEAMKQSRY